MQQIFRVYVEKRPGFAVGGGIKKLDLADHLHLDLEQVRIFVRYDVEGIDQETYCKARDTIFPSPTRIRCMRKRCRRLRAGLSLGWNICPANMTSGRTARPSAYRSCPRARRP